MTEDDVWLKSMDGARPVIFAKTARGRSKGRDFLRALEKRRDDRSRQIAFTFEEIVRRMIDGTGSQHEDKVKTLTGMDFKDTRGGRHSLAELIAGNRRLSYTSALGGIVIGPGWQKTRLRQSLDVVRARDFMKSFLDLCLEDGLDLKRSPLEQNRR